MRLQIIGDDLRRWPATFVSFNPGTVAGPETRSSLSPAAAAQCPAAVDVPTLNSARGDRGPRLRQRRQTLRLAWRTCAPGTDILVVRRASTLRRGQCRLRPRRWPGMSTCRLSGCGTGIQRRGPTTRLDSNAGNLNLHQKDCATAALIYQFRSHVYFVRQQRQAPATASPTLKRAELGGGALSTSCPWSKA